MFKIIAFVLFIYTVYKKGNTIIDIYMQEGVCVELLKHCAHINISEKYTLLFLKCI